MAGYIGKSQGVTQVDGYNRTEADDRYANITGDTFTGPVTATTLRQKNSFAFRAYQTASQVISNGVFTKVEFNGEDFDVGSAYDNSTSYRFAPNVAGYYQLTAKVLFMATSLDRLIVRITKNGAEAGSYGRNCDFTGLSSPFFYVTVTDLMYLNGSSDYADVYAWVSGSGTLLVGSNDANTSVFTGLLVEEA